MILANVTNGIYIAGVNGPFYVIISLDFSVTFDTLSHLLFLKKKKQKQKKTFSAASVTSFFPFYPIPFLYGHPFSSLFLWILLQSWCCPGLTVPADTFAFCILYLLHDDLRYSHLVRYHVDNFSLEFLLSSGLALSNVVATSYI